MSKYRLVVFDWEGTLVDTLGPIITTLQTEADRLHYGEIDEVIARQYLMLGLVVAIKKIFPSLTLTQHEGLLQTAQEALTGRSQEVYLIPGVETILKQIKKLGMDLAIATNKGHQSLHRAMQHSHIETYFTTTRSAGQTPSKPCPQMLQEIMDFCAVDSKHTVMIGDSVSDIEMAKELGVDAIGVNFYHQNDQEAVLLSAGALTVVDCFQFLANYLKIPMDNDNEVMREYTNQLA